MHIQVQVNTNYGEEVYLCGDHPSVGQWIPSKGLKMYTSNTVYPQWVGRLVLDEPLPNGQLLYKYVIRVSADSWMWEDR